MIVAAPSDIHNGRGPWRTAVVFLDMVHQEHCVYADDVVGVVKRVAQRPNGGFVIDLFGDLVEETVHGNVTIIERSFVYAAEV